MRVHTYTELELTDDPNIYLIRADEFYDYSGPIALADRAAQAQASQAANTAKGAAAGYGDVARGIGNEIVPQLERDVTNPQGFTPSQLNDMLVAGEQGAGGVASGITGQAGLQAMRTRNSAALSGVLDENARRKMQTTSQNALNVRGEQARLQQAQRASALRQLESLYGTDVGGQLRAMGIIPEDINAELAAGRQGWLQNTEGVISTLGNLGLGAAKAAGFG
jgi:hypothetical protein